jgi:hypothetical protein
MKAFTYQQFLFGTRNIIVSSVDRMVHIDHVLYNPNPVHKYQKLSSHFQSCSSTSEDNIGLVPFEIKTALGLLLLESRLSYHECCSAVSKSRMDKHLRKVW